MIYTVTFNPAIDYHVTLDSLTTGKVNRCKSESIFFGGKGINVSYVLKQLDIDNIAIAFTAGFTGKAIEDGLNKQGIKTDFIHLEEGSSRINYKITTDVITDINGVGPDINQNHLEMLNRKLQLLKSGDILVLAGSVPNLPQDAYEQILSKLSGKGVMFFVDTYGNLLLNTLKYHPFLIKPNIDELSELFDKEIESELEIVEAAKQLQAMGALNVLVSMGDKGAILVCTNGVCYQATAVQGNVVDTVGAGDSMVAGFIKGYLQSKDYKYAFCSACAAASATVFTKGLADKSQILSFVDKYLLTTRRFI